MCQFGQIIRNERLKKHITQRELAKRIGVDFSYISKIETRALEPPLARKIPTEITELIFNNKDIVEHIRKFL